MNIKQRVLRKYIKFLLRAGNYYKASEILDKLKNKTESEKQLANIIRPHWTEEEMEIIKSKPAIYGGDEDRLFKPEDFRYWDGEVFEKNGDQFLKITSLDKVKLQDPIIKPVNVFLGIDGK